MYSYALFFFAAFLLPKPSDGKFTLAGTSGISPMSSFLTSKNTVVFVDRTNFKYPQSRQPDGTFAFSTEYVLADQSFRYLHTKTNAFCAGGQAAADGSFIMTGGEDKGALTGGSIAIRHFAPCSDKKCDWDQKAGLLSPRWYPSVLRLSDGKMIIVGGTTTGTKQNTDVKAVNSYEFFPREPGFDRIVPMKFLNDTMPDNLFPFLHLLPNGNVFVAANSMAMVFNPKDIATEVRLPSLPDGATAHRSYPYTGSSVMLPLTPDKNGVYPAAAEIMICGGGDIKGFPKGIEVPAVKTCARMKADPRSTGWEMEEMPWGIVMPNMVLLPDGKVLIINGALAGHAGFLGTTKPARQPLLYDPKAPKGKRFTKLEASKIDRVYHSEALLIPDGRVLVSGSQPKDKGVDLEFRVEMFQPPYRAGTPRPLIKSCSKASIGYGDYFTCTLQSGQKLDITQWEAAFIETGFSTHSHNMGQRLVHVNVQPCTSSAGSTELLFRAPPSSKILPPGSYMFFLVHSGVPSVAQWISVGGTDAVAGKPTSKPAQCIPAPASLISADSFPVPKLSPPVPPAPVGTTSNTDGPEVPIPNNANGPEVPIPNNTNGKDEPTPNNTNGEEPANPGIITTSQSQASPNSLPPAAQLVGVLMLTVAVLKFAK